jgi:CheY-like chemotaxis protein
MSSTFEGPPGPGTDWPSETQGSIRVQLDERSPAEGAALIVDDDYRNALALTAVLEGEGLSVVAVSNGPVALTTLDDRDDISIVLLDIMMPGMDGYETIAAIRERPKSADLPIIAVTAKDAVGERERCLFAGASDYVAKPFEKADLLSALSTYLPNHASTSPA